MCSKLPATFALFPILSRRYAHMQLSRVYIPPLYLYRFSCEKKYQALHACTTSMFTFWSMGAWERGYIKPQTLTSAHRYKVRTSVCVCFSCLQSSVPGRPAECETKQHDARVEHLQWKDDRNNGKYPSSGN